MCLESIVLESIAPDQQVTQIPVHLLTFFSHAVTEMAEAITMSKRSIYFGLAILRYNLCLLLNTSHI